MASSIDDNGEACPLWRLTVGDILDSRSQSSINAVQGASIALLFVIVLTFMTSELTQNYSQVDKIWSITPIIYAWILVCDARTFLMALLVSVWGCRLTWNFHRRGGYTWPPWQGNEDYRWKYLQDGFLWDGLRHPVLWKIFNLLFISMYQNLLLLWIVSPSIIAHLVASHCPRLHNPLLNVIDVSASFLYVSLVVVEAIADNQQYTFQEEKHHVKSAGEKPVGEYKNGFKNSGLFSVLRKPNYACEQALWIVYYLFSISCFKIDVATHYTLNWSAVGWTMLVLLFQGSGYLTEKITISKYPLYKEYMKDTPLYIPNLFQLLGITTWNKKKI